MTTGIWKEANENYNTKLNEYKALYIELQRISNKKITSIINDDEIDLSKS